MEYDHIVRLLIIFLVCILIPIILIYEYKLKIEEIYKLNDGDNTTGRYCWICLFKQYRKARKSKIYRNKIDKRKSIMQATKSKTPNSFLDTNIKFKNNKK